MALHENTLDPKASGQAYSLRTRIVLCCAALAVAPLGACGDDSDPTAPVGPPAQLAFVTIPDALEANGALEDPIVVAIQDEAGNIVTDATGEVTLSLANHARGGALVGTLTVDASGGLATFSDVAIDRSGTGYELLAVSSALPDTASATLDVTFTWMRIQAGDGHTCGLQVTGFAYCWGLNVDGALGDGNDGTDRDTPVAVVGGLEFATIDAEKYHTCAITGGGETYCWGNNTVGQLGDGTSGGHRSAPGIVGGDVEFAVVSGGHNHTCGVTGGGAAYCWGGNSYGQLGDDNVGVDRDTPGAVSTDLPFAAISAGYTHTCGLTDDGEAYCWGFNGNGELGDGAMGIDRDTPGAVAGDLEFAAVTVGNFHSCGLTPDGEAYCWGDNPDGQLGDDNAGVDRDTPGAVSTDLGFAAIHAGSDHTCGLTAAGEAHCWGWNAYGQLGDGTVTTAQDTPVAVLGGIEFTSLSAGYDHTCGITADGEAYCWGRNRYGQLGDGNVGTDSGTPVRVLDP